MSRARAGTTPLTQIVRAFLVREAAADAHVLREPRRWPASLVARALGQRVTAVRSAIRRLRDAGVVDTARGPDGGASLRHVENGGHHMSTNRASRRGSGNARRDRALTVAYAKMHAATPAAARALVEMLDDDDDSVRRQAAATIAAALRRHASTDVGDIIAGEIERWIARRAAKGGR